MKILSNKTYKELLKDGEKKRFLVQKLLNKNHIIKGKNDKICTWQDQFLALLSHYKHSENHRDYIIALGPIFDRENYYGEFDFKKSIQQFVKIDELVFTNKIYGKSFGNLLKLTIFQVIELINFLSWLEPASEYELLITDFINEKISSPKISIPKQQLYEN